MNKGKIIILEGTDGSGKKTQANLLIERFRAEGIPFEMMSFPRYDTPTGRIVGQCYLGKEKSYWVGDSGWFGEADSLDPKVASLYYAADRRAAIPDILKIINSGTNLILDRYYYSNMAHQGGKIRDSEERMRIFEWLRKLELDLLELPKEDLVIFLHMPAEVAIELKKGMEEKRDSHENLEHMKRAEEAYLQLSRIHNWYTIEC